MGHEEWRDLEAERLRRLRDRDRGDFGQADYSNLYGYDARRRTGYRAYEDGRDPERPSFDEAREPRRARRDGPSDRVLWAVITERLEDERRLALRDVEVIVQDREVTLNGAVRHKQDKRRIEDVADIEGVRHVQNNLRVESRDSYYSETSTLSDS